MSFRDDMQRFQAKVQANAKSIFVNVASHAHESIVNGSSVTGAPGQPVDTSALRNSWQLTFPSAGEAHISTNLVYAPYIEDGVVTARTGQVTGHTKQRLTLRSQVGGFHSVKLTVAGLPRIVEYETAKVLHGTP